jgi:hypothetical protein
MTYVYESPDGGQTVYRRRPGSLDRQLHHINNNILSKHERQEKQMLWQQILVASETNAVLKDLVDRTLAIYQLGSVHE